MLLRSDRAGSGPVVLFVHGIGGTLAFWDDVVPSFVDDFTCVRVDVPGFGGSPALDGDVTVAGLAAALDDWLAAEQLDRIVVVGHSLGGMVAQELALAGSDRVRGAVLCNTIPGTTERVGDINRGLATMAEQQGAAPLAEAMLPAMLGPDELENTPRARARFLADFGAASPSSLAAALLAVTTFDARRRLPQLGNRGRPVLVIAGEHEGNEADQRELAELSGARFVTLPGTSHLAPAEAPSAFAAEVGLFLASLTEGSTWR